MAWLTGWSYRKPITISNAATDYQTKITIYYGSGTDGDNYVYCNSHCKTDFGDIRFTKSDGTTLLDIWRESKTDSDNAVFWVQNDGAPQTSGYIYYGNSGATYPYLSSELAHGEATFIFFDDFNAGNLNKWTGDTSYARIESGICIVSGASSAWRWIFSDTTIGATDFAVRAKLNHIAGDGGAGAATLDQAHKIVTYRYGPTPCILSRDGTTQSFVASNWAINAYKVFDYIARGGLNSRFFQDGVECSNSPKTTNPPNSNSMRAALAAFGMDAIQCDWILLRKYMTTEPTFTFEAEQKAYAHTAGFIIG